MNISLGKYAPYAKAIAAFIALLVPFITSIATALADGSIGSAETTTIVIAFGALIAGTKTVYQVRNKKV